MKMYGSDVNIKCKYNENIYAHADKCNEYNEAVLNKAKDNWCKTLNVQNLAAILKITH